MDAAHKSPRLYPAYTTADLRQMLNDPSRDNETKARIEMAIDQRDENSPNYIPRFVVPQIGRA